MITIGSKVQDKVYSAFELRVSFYDKCAGTQEVSYYFFMGPKRSDQAPTYGDLYGCLIDCDINRVEALYAYIANLREEDLQEVLYSEQENDVYKHYFFEQIPQDFCSGVPYSCIDGVELFYHDKEGVKYEAIVS